MLHKQHRYTRRQSFQAPQCTQTREVDGSRWNSSSCAEVLCSSHVGAPHQDLSAISQGRSGPGEMEGCECDTDLQEGQQNTSSKLQTSITHIGAK